MSSNDDGRPATRLVTLGRDPKASFDYVNPPLVRGSTVLHHDGADMRDRVARRNAGGDGEAGTPAAYGIYGTPTHLAFYRALTALEGGHRSWAFPFVVVLLAGPMNKSVLVLLVLAPLSLVAVDFLRWCFLLLLADARTFEGAMFGTPT